MKEPADPLADLLPGPLAELSPIDVLRILFVRLGVPRDAEIDALLALQLIGVLAARIIALEARVE